MSILVAPIYNVEHFYDGNHLSEIGLAMEPFEKRSKKTKNKLFVNNEIPRYHHLIFPADVLIVESVIDFKHYFSMKVPSVLTSRNYRCKENNNLRGC